MVTLHAPRPVLDAWDAVRVWYAQHARSHALSRPLGSGRQLRFSAIIDTDGPITVVAPDLFRGGRDPVARDEAIVPRLEPASAFREARSR